MRNPLDIIVSMLGVSELDPTPDAIDQKISELARQGMDDALWALNQNRVLVLRYEDFYGDSDRLFDSLHAFLGVSASQEARNEFEERFSIEAVKERAQSLESFDRFDADDQIHGRHISKKSGRPGAHLEILDQPTMIEISKRFPEFFEAFGY